MTTPEFSDDDDLAVDRWSSRLASLGHIYRYRSLSDFNRFEELVLGGRFYFPAFKTLNDPFDGKVRVDFDGSVEVRRAYWEAHCNETGQEIDSPTRAKIEGFVAKHDDPAFTEVLLQTYLSSVSEFGVACFSETPDDIPMWAYYGDSQRGVCLRFLARRLLGWDGCFPPMPVDYLAEYPQVGFYRHTKFERNRLTVAAKADAWRHEREWRMIRHRGAGHIAFPRDALEGIIMGCSISADDEARVRGVVAGRSPHIQLLKASPVESRFALQVVDA